MQFFKYIITSIDDPHFHFLPEVTLTNSNKLKHANLERIGQQHNSIGNLFLIFSLLWSYKQFRIMTNKGRQNRDSTLKKIYFCYTAQMHISVKKTKTKRNGIKAHCNSIENRLAWGFIVL